jgi:structural maintenance of chromosome 3 (chondroitin sulfate proteoglycan 6)
MHVLGARLFYHVVDDDRIATKIINEMNRMKLAGEVNFFPLNRLAHVQDPQYPVNQVCGF